MGAWRWCNPGRVLRTASLTALAGLLHVGAAAADPAAFQVAGAGTAATKVTTNPGSPLPGSSTILQPATTLNAPRLTIVQGNNRRIRLNWPATAIDYRLEMTTSLIPPVTWTVVTPAPGVENGRFIYRLNPVGEAQFFRLHKP